MCIRSSLTPPVSKLTFVKMSESIFTGPGEVLLAPETWGDIVPINMDGSTTWFFGKNAFLGATRDIIRANKTQSFGKAICKSVIVRHVDFETELCP